MKRWLILLIIIPIANAKAITQYPPQFEQIEWGDRISFPHIYPGQSITTEERFLEDPLRPGTSIVRWTRKACHSITLDKVHLMRGTYTLKIKNKYGPQIRMLPFETTKIYLTPDYYKIRFDKTTSTVWIARYAE
ncbi:hypothetical protein KY309_01825 [Candidatus Woesearchaeota archaeon]|nr:hypothetical protein [Candidatus Woesearchaeota archaeon]MBW3016328.1 hypothetical protein [Candidatus Woesearchaeota archaeon]